MYISDRERLEAELERLELKLLENKLWTVQVSQMYIRRESIKKLLKTMKGDWFD